MKLCYMFFFRAGGRRKMEDRGSGGLEAEKEGRELEGRGNGAPQIFLPGLTPLVIRWEKVG